MDHDKIIYPARFEPSNSPIFVRNEIKINATPEKVWFWLTNATTWNEWYFNASNVQITNQQNNHLLAGTMFNWRTSGISLKSAVKEFIPYQRLAWEAKGTGVSAYHAWLLVPTENGCKVITVETQHGWFCRLGKLLMPNRMYKFHQIWLEGLKTKAEQE
ncbi:uncharacterized protein YndB with AHSA1/START domain [Pedobacter sp. UYP24]